MIKTNWRCPQGHEWPSPYHGIQQGNGCPECAGTKPKVAEDYQELAVQRGFTWLGPEVDNTTIKTSWRYPQGHEWPAPYHSIQQGSGCPECAELLKYGRSAKCKEPEDYRELAAARGIEWLGPEVANGKTRTNWRCPEGHEWLASYNNIQQGRGCPECAEVKPRVSEDYLELAAEQGLTWLGPEVANARVKTNWLCPQRHEWPAPYYSIQQGEGCPECAGVKPKVPKDYRELSAARGFTWLGPEVANVTTKTNWRCPQGHEWPARYSSIQQGRGCPECARARRRG